MPVVRFGPLFSRWSSVLGFHFGDSIFGAPFWWWSVFGAPFWCRWSVLGLHFGAGGPFWVHFGASGPFWGSILVPVVRFGAPLWHRWSVFGAPLWCRWSVLGLGFGSVVRFWGSVLVPLVGFGACRWSVLGLHFGAGGPFWGSIVVRVVRFWSSILVPVVRFGARFWSVFWGSILVPVVRFWGSVLVPLVGFGAPSWYRWSVLGLHFGAGGPFLGLHFGAGGPFWGSVLVRFGGSILVPVVRSGARFWCRWSILGLDFGPGSFWGSEQQDVDNDSLLVLRLMFLIALMKQYTQKPTASFLEHPQDPVECSGSPSAHRCSSLWATKVFREWQTTVGHHLVKFDQCRLGQLVAKSTTLSSDLDICCWDGLKCNHPNRVLPEDMKSSDLSRYPPPMMLGLAGAISKKLQDIGKISSRPTISWNTTPSTDPHVVHRDPVSDRPSSLPLAHRISLMDENLVVQLGFRTRPLRDGGGKPSPGKLPPPLRRASALAHLGTRIQQLTDPFSQAVRMSISCGEKNHPFPDSLLHQIREAMGATPTPFFLTLMSWLAKEAGDPDWEYPLTLQEGVPLGVDETTLSSPGIWPTKEELRGIPDEYEDLATPVGRHNYDSAEEFSDAIKQTFEEEKLLDMVEGPFTKQEAANRCNCSPSQLCPGPMAAIDEGDKIRTIYDGSFGGANPHIQQNTPEKTTAPTVMDCMHGIHWINASASLSPGDHTAVSQGGRATASGVDSSSQGGGTWSWPGPDTTLLILKADVSKAHRRIKILPSGWKYQVAQIDQQWWVNKVGTWSGECATLLGTDGSFVASFIVLLIPRGGLGIRLC